MEITEDITMKSDSYTIKTSVTKIHLHPIPYRLLPRTDCATLEALEEAQCKLKSLSAGQGTLLRSSTRSRLKRLLPLFREELSDRDGVVGQQTEATETGKRKKAELLSVTKQRDIDVY
jgi:hypothetical protein